MSPDPTSGADEHGGADAPKVPDSDESGALTPDEPRRRRKHRRAVGGTVPPSPEPSAGRPKPDDLDIAWGDQPPGSDDERFLREVPPHW